MVTVSRLGKGLILAKLKVFVDDQKVGVLKYNQSKSFDVASGHHSIYLKMDWIKSNVIEFNAAADKDSKFNCIIALRTETNREGFWQYMKQRKYLWMVIVKQIQ